jgi:aspartyl-tRNA(Asn)/glutamyl-tRNA(Gln) amidotransferase subunit A
MAKKLNEYSIVEAAAALRGGVCTVRELWNAVIAEAERRNPELNAYLELFAADDAAINAAQARIDAERNGIAGETAPLLCGIPLAIKDNILLEGHIASASSKMLSTHVAVYDATVITKLRAAGALFVGRTNMDEFAMGSSTEHSAYGTSKNPYDVSRVPGGSSGGSASAVAAHLCIAALGTDTGGSIRQPAAHCGLAGLKPTYGSVSRYGAIALGSSLDQIGPLTKTLEDAKILYAALTGIDAKDSTTIPDTLYPKKSVQNKVRIGVPYHLLAEGIDPDVLAAFTKTIESLKAKGNTIVDVSLPASTYALAAYYVIMPAEASTNLSRYDGIRYGHAARGETLLEDYVQSRTEGFGLETKRRILLGTFVLSSGYIDAYYRKAEASRDLLRSEYNAAFEQCDVIAFPTTPSPAFKFGEKSDPVSMYLEDIFTVTANLTGMPAISIPMGSVVRDAVTLPVGIHFTAAHGQEDILFTVGKEISA